MAVIEFGEEHLHVSVVVVVKVVQNAEREETGIVGEPVVVVVVVAGPDKFVADDADKVVETVVGNAVAVIVVVGAVPGGLLADINFAKNQNSHHNHTVEKVVSVNLKDNSPF